MPVPVGRQRADLVLFEPAPATPCHRVVDGVPRAPRHRPEEPSEESPSGAEPREDLSCRVGPDVESSNLVHEDHRIHAADGGWCLSEKCLGGAAFKLSKAERVRAVPVKDEADAPVTQPAVPVEQDEGVVDGWPHRGRECAVGVNVALRLQRVVRGPAPCAGTFGW